MAPLFNVALQKRQKNHYKGRVVKTGFVPHEMPGTIENYIPCVAAKNGLRNLSGDPVRVILSHLCRRLPAGFGFFSILISHCRSPVHMVRTNRAV